MTLRFAILYLAAAAVWAQSPQRDSAAIAGRVVSAADGSPLAGALVLVRAASAPKAWTGPDGRFRIAGIPTGTYGLMASKAGYHPDQQRRQVAAGGEGPELLIRLTPDSLIAGTAEGPDGAPLEGAKIGLWEQPDRLGDVPILMERRTVTVDDRGRFRLHGLRAGNYLLALEPTAAPAPEGVERLDAAPMLYPQPSGLGGLAMLRLRPGERVENVDFRAPKPSQTALAGQVSSCSACTVAIYRRSGEFFAPIYQVGAAGDGSFFLEGLAPGAYVIAARSRGPNRGALAGLAEVSLTAGQTTRTQVYLTEGAQMTITKTHLNPPEQDQPAQRRGMIPPAVAFEYLGPELVRSMPRGGRLARLDENATEIQVGLWPGPYALRIRGIPRGGYLASVLVDGSPPLDGRIVIGDGGAHETQVLVAYDSGTVEGTVTASDDLPLKGASIYLLPQNPVLPSDLSMAAADGTGAFSAEVGPGRYEVYALPRDSDWNLADSFDRQRLAGYRAGVDVRPGQTTMVKVRLAPLSSW